MLWAVFLNAPNLTIGTSQCLTQAARRRVGECKRRGGGGGERKGMGGGGVRVEGGGGQWRTLAAAAVNGP